MDLSNFDLIAKYYFPCEQKINRILGKLRDYREDLLISFIDVIDKNQLSDKSKKVVITDQLIDPDCYPEKTILKLPDSIFGIYYIPVPLENKDILLDFNLFMNRADINRLFWFYKMLELGWDNGAAMSYIGATKRSSRPDLSAVEFLDFLYQEYFFPNYQNQHTLARSHIPYQNFKDLGDLRSVMIETKLSVVIETYHERTDAIPFSEKIFRALQVPRPWVLSGATGSVQRLRSLGFDVFDDYIDHTYDSYCTKENVIKQTDAIMGEIERIKKLKITQDILDDWYRRYQKNMEILSSWNLSWKTDLQKFILTHFPNISITESLA